MGIFYVLVVIDLQSKIPFWGFMLLGSSFMAMFSISLVVAFQCISLMFNLCVSVSICVFRYLCVSVASHVTYCKDWPYSYNQG